MSFGHPRTRSSNTRDTPSCSVASLLGTTPLRQQSGDRYPIKESPERQLPRPQCPPVPPRAARATVFHPGRQAMRFGFDVSFALANANARTRERLRPLPQWRGANCWAQSSDKERNYFAIQCDETPNVHKYAFRFMVQSHLVNPMIREIYPSSQEGKGVRSSIFQSGASAVRAADRVAWRVEIAGWGVATSEIDSVADEL